MVLYMCMLNIYVYTGKDQEKRRDFELFVRNQTSKSYHKPFPPKSHPLTHLHFREQFSNEPLRLLEVRSIVGRWSSVVQPRLEPRNPKKVHR